MINKKVKTFADCAIYAKVDEAGFSTERALITFIMSADRIDISSNAFKGVVSQLKSRAQSAVVIRMLQQGNVVLGIASKELSPSMKVFYAKDIKAGNKSKKVFVDVTGIITLENGFFVCKNIDKFAAYLLGVLIMETYYTDPNKFISNGALQKLSTTSFIKLYCALLNELRMPGYINNKAKIQYIVGVYFAHTVMGLELPQARLVASSAMSMNKQEAATIDFYYSEDDLKNIYAFTESITKTFKLKDLTTDGLINKWIYAYGKGTMYALELYPAFLTLVMYAYSGSYINNMKRIESVLKGELVEIANIVLRVGNDAYAKGFKYESANDRLYYFKQFKALMEAHNLDLSLCTESTDDLDPQEITTDAIDQEKKDTPETPEETDTLNKEINNDSPMTEGTDEIDPEEISKEGLKSEQEDQGPKTPEEADTLVDELKKDSPMTEGTDDLDAEAISKDAVKSEDDKLPETNGETKTLEDNIVEDRVLK